MLWKPAPISKNCHLKHSQYDRREPISILWGGQGFLIYKERLSNQSKLLIWTLSCPYLVYCIQMGMWNIPCQMVILPKADTFFFTTQMKTSWLAEELFFLGCLLSWHLYSPGMDEKLQWITIDSKRTQYFLSSHWLEGTHAEGWRETVISVGPNALLVLFHLVKIIGMSYLCYCLSG